MSFCLVTLICSLICSIYRYCRDFLTEERNLNHVGDIEIELSNSFNDLGNHYENNDGHNSLIENNWIIKTFFGMILKRYKIKYLICIN